MKKVLFGVLMTFTSQAFSCPNLDGIYLACKTTSQVFENPVSQIISQGSVGGRATFRIGDDSFNVSEYVEGQKFTRTEAFEEEEGVDLVSTFKVGCTKKELKIEYFDVKAVKRPGSSVSNEDLELINDMVQTFAEKSKMSYSKDSRGDLVVSTYFNGDLVNETFCTKF